MGEIVRVKDVMSLITTDAYTVNENDSLDKIIREMVKDPKTQSVYVVNDKEELVGIITLDIALQYLYSEYIPPQYLEFNISVMEGANTVAKNIMLPPVYVKESTPISEAFTKMFEYHLHEIPVVDENMRVIGDVHGLELIQRKLSTN